MITYPADFPHLSRVGKSKPVESTTLCLALAHNEANVIGEFLYLSSDGTRELLEAQPDVTIYQPKIAAFGKAGRLAALQVHARCRGNTIHRGARPAAGGGVYYKDFSRNSLLLKSPADPVTTIYRNETSLGALLN